MLYLSRLLACARGPHGPDDGIPHSFGRRTLYWGIEMLLGINIGGFLD